MIDIDYENRLMVISSTPYRGFISAILFYDLYNGELLFIMDRTGKYWLEGVKPRYKLLSADETTELLDLHKSRYGS
jgi:hypothetical protein